VINRRNVLLGGTWLAAASTIVAGNPIRSSSQTITRGQQIDASNTGRAGAAAAGLSGYSATMTTVSGTQMYSTTRTFNNVHFTGEVNVTGGVVSFNFCLFDYKPPSRGHALRLYNNGNRTGQAVINWCDFDTGLRGISQGNFETTAFQCGERGSVNSKTTDLNSYLTAYRCRVEGWGNSIGFHQFQGGMNTVTECLMDQLTMGGGTHADGIEIYSSDNVTIQRSRIKLTNNDWQGRNQSCINITNDFGDVMRSNPIIVLNCYIDGGGSPVLTRTQGGTYKRNVSYIGNYFGDDSYFGRLCDFNAMKVTFDQSYFNANTTTDPTGIIYWALDNVWAPNGENVTQSSPAPSGDTPFGLPHSPGGFISQANFGGGEVWHWNGILVGPIGPPVVTGKQHSGRRR
jgi:hypothetical protein